MALWAKSGIPANLAGAGRVSYYPLPKSCLPGGFGGGSGAHDAGGDIRSLAMALRLDDAD